ncbi:MAG: B12-binding domain-containing protein [Planctomycetota bacterium]|nr:B12-binding domain-containing protein [Planctomycetota bacterium]
MQYISPRQLARAAGVSESSIKRWCDQGQIPTVKTAGGHRRVTLDAATEFLRQSRAEFHPELLGLPSRRGHGERTVRNLIDDLYREVVAGDEEACHRILFELHLAGEPMSRIFDVFVTPALHRVGDGWECGDVQVYQERRACSTILRAFDRLKSVIPSPSVTAPLAIGGTPECDPYTVPTEMVELVLRQGDWRSRSLGSRLPFATMITAIRDLKPELYWLSVSYLDDVAFFLDEYRNFYAQVQDDVAIVVGGQGLTPELRKQISFAAYCDNMQHLESFARTMRRTCGDIKGRTSTHDKTDTKPSQE